MNKNLIDKHILLGHSFIENKSPFINTFSEIIPTLKLIEDTNDISRFFYSQKSVINKILDNEDQIIEISNNKYDFKFYFYLALLLEDNYDIVNYTYEYDLIQDLDNEIRNEKEIIKKVIKSIIILGLIYNFKGFNRNKKLNSDLDNIEKYNIENIKNNKHVLEEFNLNINEDEVDEISLEEIYGKILSYLIEHKKLEDYDYSYNIIINQLEINNIDITKKMFDELSRVLNSNESFITDYSISNSEDLLNINKINFYFILFKYILKDSQKIYNIPFLINTKNIVINQLKHSLNLDLDKIDNDIKERCEFNIKFILDSKYYYNIYLNNKNIKKVDVSVILEYYKNYFFETKKTQITEIENGHFNFKSNAEEVNKAKIMNEKYCIIEFIFNNKFSGKEKTEEKIQSIVISWEKFEKMIKDKKLKKMRKDDKMILGKFFGDPNNKDLLIKIFGEDCYENFIKESVDVINTENKRNIDINALKEILKYYQTFLFESKSNDINLIENAIKTGGIEVNYELYLKDLEIAKKLNIKFPLINYLFNVQNEEGKMTKTESEMKEKLQRYEVIEKMIKDKKIKKMRKEDKNKIFNYFNDQNNKSILLEIFGKDAYEFILKASIDYINQNKKKKNLDSEILNKLEEVLKYYKQYMPQTKKEEIKSLEDIIKNNSDKYEIYLNDYETAKEMNLKTPLISLLGNLNDNEEDIKKALSTWEATVKMIKDKKIKKMRGDNKKKLINFFKNKSNKELLIKIFNEEYYDFFIKQNNIKVEEDDNQNDNAPNNKEKIKKEIISKSENKNSNDKELLEVQEKIIHSENASMNLSINNTQSTALNTNKHKPEKEKEISETSKTKEEEIAEFILKYTKIKLHTNGNKEQMAFKYDEIITVVKNNNILIEYEQLQKCEEYFNQNNKETVLAKSFLEFMKFLVEFKNRIKKEFKYKYSLKMELEFSRVYNDDRDNNRQYNIQCIYNLFSPVDNHIESFKEENVLINKTNSPVQGFEYLKSEINNEKYQDIIDSEEEKQKNVNPQNESNNSTNLDDNNQKINKNVLGILSAENKVLEKNIINNDGCLGSHRKGIAESITELSNHDFISISSEGSILLFNDKLEIYDQITEALKDFKNYIYSTLEIKNNKKKNDKEIHIVGCCNKELTVFHFNFDKQTFKKENYEFPDMTCITCVQMNDYNFVVTGQNSTTYFTNLFFEKNKDVFHTDLVKHTTYRGAIKISDTIIALSSNSILVDGKDKLAFYSITKRKEEKGPKKGPIEISKITEVIGYSFIASTNGLFLMSKEKEEQQNKILFCACKKYFQNQKNGILLIDVLDVSNQRAFPLYETDNFEVYCFCPIYLDVKDKDKKILSDYFLVGGFDVDRREGRIKLFKAIYDEENAFTNIEYLQDIEIGFEGAVSSIIQSQNYGNILVTCYDGNIYLLNKINLGFYLMLDSTFE